MWRESIEPIENDEIVTLCVDTIRFLAADAVEKANSGHPGAPMGMADIIYVLYSRYLRYNPEDPDWPNRDRFVLSAGHASMVLYTILHLTGYPISLEDIKNFRQLHSKTPGHPESYVTPGVECSTGPLGAGFGNAVGMALASKMLGARFNGELDYLIDSRVFMLCSDGDIEEGISNEAASLAGHLGLGNLIAIYDSNDTTIAGPAGLSITEDVGKRFEALGWHVEKCNGHDHVELDAALDAACHEFTKPSLIVAETIIGKGAPNKQGTCISHGAPLGEEEVRAAKIAHGWDPDKTFYIPEGVKELFQPQIKYNQKIYHDWQVQFKKWCEDFPELAREWEQQYHYDTPENLLDQLMEAIPAKDDATRSFSGNVIQRAAKLIPNLISGCADLEPSTKTQIKGSTPITHSSLKSAWLPDPSFHGRNIHFGVREHAMGAICNGITLFGGFRTLCSTFLVFSDYMRATIRLAALSKLPVIFVFTHDSFYVGEDGPTHQPIEHAWSLRLIPNLNVWRPADGMETAAAYAHALDKSNRSVPSAFLFTRQKVKALIRKESFDKQELFKGAYVVTDAPSGMPELIVAATGSENTLAQDVCATLREEGKQVRHVSIPCLELFEQQPQQYRDSVLPKNVKTVVIEAGTTLPWYKYADHVIGRDDFGHSAPENELAELYGFTPAKVLEQIKQWI